VLKLGVLFVTLCTSSAYHYHAHAADKLCEHQFKACSLSARLRHAYRHLVFKNELVETILSVVSCQLQCFDAVGWAAGRASGLQIS